MDKYSDYQLCQVLSFFDDELVSKSKPSETNAQFEELMQISQPLNTGKGLLNSDSFSSQSSLINFNEQDIDMNNDRLYQQEIQGQMFG